MKSESGDNDQPKFNFLTKHLSMRGWHFIIDIGRIYLFIKPGMGIFELIPDNLPFIGNLDEGAATMLIWYGIVEILEMRRRRREANDFVQRLFLWQLSQIPCVLLIRNRYSL
jgi:hypothetical protein